MNAYALSYVYIYIFLKNIKIINSKGNFSKFFATSDFSSRLVNLLSLSLFLFLFLREKSL